MMEQWNDGILGPFVFHLVEKYYGSWDLPAIALDILSSVRALFHNSNIPSFHMGGLKPLPLKTA